MANAVRHLKGNHRKYKLVVISLVCLAVLGLSGPTLLLAQGELTLEDLSEQLQALTSKVTAVTERIDTIEALWVNSEPTILLDGSCVVGSEGGVQDATVLSYKQTFDEWPNTDHFKVVGVSYNSETGVIGIQYEELLKDQSTIEFWQDCEYIESADWWKRDYGDEAFEGYTDPTE